MLGKRFNKEIILGILFSNGNIFIEGIFGLILYPILLFKYDVEIAGLWIFFLSFYPIINLAQGGLGTVISRVANKNTKFDVLTDFRRQVKLLYQGVVFSMLLICFLLYLFYIRPRIEELNLYKEGTWAWVLISSSFFVKMYFNRNFHILNSFGIVGRDKLSTSIATIINIIGISIVVYLGFNISGLGITYLFSSLIYGGISTSMIKIIKPEEKFNNNSKISITEIAGLLNEGGKILLLNLSAFIVLQLGLFISESYFGLKLFTYYSALVKISAVVIAISSSISSVLFPFIAISFNQNQTTPVVKRFNQNIIISIFTALVLYTILIATAELIIPFWLGEDGYLGLEIFLPICILGLLYIAHTSHANSIIATGSNTFLIPAIINSVLSSSLMILGAKYFNLKGMIYGGILGCLPSSLYVIIWSRNFMKNLHEREN